VTQRGWLPWALGAMTGLAIGFGVLLVLRGGPSTPLRGDAGPRESASSSVTSRPFTGAGIGSSRSNAIVRAVEGISPAVVSINILRDAPPPTPFEIFGGRRRVSTQERGLGSGFVVDHRGYVLTAYHVIAGSNALTVTLPDGQVFEAEVVGASREFDLAVVKIRGTVRGLPVARLGSSEDLRNGEWAIALGSPFADLAYDNAATVTVGVISAVHIDVTNISRNATYLDMIQTDAAIQPGNSGGPLVNADGEVVGVNTLEISSAAGATGLGLAIPIDRARWVLDEMLEHGRVRPFTVGIQGNFLTENYRHELRLGDDTPGGWYVKEVLEDLPGARAGLQSGDVIVSVDGTRLVDMASQRRSLIDARVGSTVRIEVWRAGKVFETPLTFVERESS